MPLQIVQVQSEQDCQGSDVEIMEVSNDRVFTVDGSRIKVKIDPTKFKKNKIIQYFKTGNQYRCVVGGTRKW